MVQNKGKWTKELKFKNCHVSVTYVCSRTLIQLISLLICYYSEIVLEIVEYFKIFKSRTSRFYKCPKVQNKLKEIFSKMIQKKVPGHFSFYGRTSESFKSAYNFLEHFLELFKGKLLFYIYSQIMA